MAHIAISLYDWWWTYVFNIVLSMKLTSIWSCIIVLVGLIGLRVSDPDIVEQLRVINFDYYQKSEEQFQNESIVLIDIGEKSLNTFGKIFLSLQKSGFFVEWIREYRDIFNRIFLIT